MNMTLDVADTTSITSALEPAWPLPGTTLPHAHLTWDEWIAQLEAELPQVMASSQPASIRFFTRGTRKTLPSWPLVATELPNFRISWGGWVSQVGGTSSSPSHQPQNPARAA